jgi:threonine dehydratase
VIGLADLEAAAARLRSVVRPTPLVVSPALSERAGRAVHLKAEHLQRTGSFKIRGAYNFIASLPPSSTRVVAASAGNHAQGVALAASLCGIESVIYMPINASLPKVEATRGYGAEVVLEGVSVDECIVLAKAHAARENAVFVPPFDDPLIIAGQGTVGLEIAHAMPERACVLVPVGGGGLIAGIATALKLTRSDVRVIGVEAAGAASMKAALEANAPVELPLCSTMADGIAVRSVSALTLEHARAYVDEVITVGEEDISQAVLFVLERHKWLIEPAAAVGIAALSAGLIGGDEPVVAVLSGGNIDPLLLTRLIEHGLSAAGRYVMLRVVLTDKPGQLARLTAVLAEMGLNVLSVDHHRSGVVVGLDEVEVLLTVETRGPAHRQAIVAGLRAAGFNTRALGSPADGGTS